MRRAVLFLLIICGAFWGADTAWGQSILLPVGSGPFATAINPQTNIALVVNQSSNSVSIIDLTTNSLKTNTDGTIVSIPVGVGPTSVAINTTTNRAVVTNFGSNNISVIDLSSYAVVATVTVGSSPRAVAIDSTHNVAIVANLNSNNVSLVDLNSNTNIVPQPITVGANPIAVAYNPANNTALVANFTGNSISVVNLTNNVVSANLSSGLGPVSIALNLGTSRAVVANQGSNDITVINLSDNSVVASSVAVGTTPFAVDINTKTNIAAVLCNGTRSISLVDLNPATPTKYNTVISAVGENPTGLAVNSNNNTGIVTNPPSNAIYIVPLAFLNYLPFAFDTDTFRSNLGINNLSTSGANVEIELIDQNGKVLKTKSVTVTGQGLNYITKINQFMLDTTTSTNTICSIQLMSDQPISSFLALINYSTNDPSIALGRPLGYTKFLINAVTNVSPYRSQLVLLNLGSGLAAVTITVYDGSTGQVLTTKTGISIPIGGFYYSNDILTDLGLSGKFGSMVVESPNLQSLIGVTVLSNTNGTNGLFEGVPLQ